jgi:putative hydrolase of the HAD superfamily
MNDVQGLIDRVTALTSPLAPRPTGIDPELAPLSHIRAVVFDVYGTLVISASGDIGASQQPCTPDLARAALAATGVDTASLPADLDGPAALREIIEASHRRSRAQGIEYPEVDILAIWRELLGASGLDLDDDSVRRIAIEYELRSNPVWPMPGLREVIAELARRRLVLGIVSNAQFYTPLMLQAFLGMDIAQAGFDLRCCAWSYREGVAKPSTRIYEPVIAGLSKGHGISPNQVLYIGNDRRNDIWPAAELGFRTALFAGDARSLRQRHDDARLAGVEPDRVLTDLMQITDALIPEAPAPLPENGER